VGKSSTVRNFSSQFKSYVEVNFEQDRELKIDYAKGYRVYFKEMNGKTILLLVGGDKSTQQKDIEKAKDILNKIKK
jgi:putative addiction module killer protein